MDSSTRRYLAEIGRRGGKKSRRVLDPTTARAMVRLREARRLYRKFHAKCFWSNDPGHIVGMAEIPWVAEQLMKYGGHVGWQAGAKLCR